MTECISGCGACCDPVVLPYTRLEAMRDPTISAEERRWASDALQPMGDKEGYAKMPHLRNRAMADQFGVPARVFFFSCRHLDQETRRCNDYENRPAVCRGFPWQGQAPRPDAGLPLQCAFRADIGEVPVALGPTRPGQ